MDLGIGEMGFIFYDKYPFLLTRPQVSDPGPRLGGGGGGGGRGGTLIFFHTGVGLDPASTIYPPPHTHTHTAQKISGISGIPKTIFEI